MRIQVYSLDENRITWSKDGTLGWKDGLWSLLDMKSDRARGRLIGFLSLKMDKLDDKEWLLSLSDVLYVPFVRFGDKIVVEKPKKKGKTDENQRISGEKTRKATE